MVYDGWRSVQLQEELFWLYMKKFTAKHFHLDEHFAGAITSSEIKECFLRLNCDLQKEMVEASKKYVSLPSKNPESPSPHSTGGSVDVWLKNHDGTVTDLGVPFDWMGEESGTFYHFSPAGKKFCENDFVARNRELLIIGMTSAGFTCYPPEIWHFNFGNQMHSLVKGGMARYSYCEPK